MPGIKPGMTESKCAMTRGTNERPPPRDPRRPAKNLRLHGGECRLDQGGDCEIPAGPAGLGHHSAAVAGGAAVRWLAAGGREPVGRTYVQLCGTTPCVLRGAEDLKAVCRRRIGEQNHVTADGKFSWIEVECLGACVNAPMVQINADYYEDLTPETFEKLLDEF